MRERRNTTSTDGGDLKSTAEVVEPTKNPGGPPDGGWGWMIVLGSFIIHAIVEGVAISYVTINEPLREYFKASPSQAMFVGSMLYGCYQIVGPFVGVLTLRFGYRRVMIGGSVLSASCFLISTQSTNITVLMVFYGIFGGIGFGLIYLPSIVAIGFWFEKNRAFATGIAVCGTGIGQFVMAPLSQYLVQEYDWHGCIVIMAGIVLNCVVCAMLFRPLEPHKPKRMKRGVVQQGSIMKALIEEKKRQRTISTGSLDNCIITRDNRIIKVDKQLIIASSRSTSRINRLLQSLGFSYDESLNRSHIRLQGASSPTSQVLPFIKVDSPSENGSSGGPIYLSKKKLPPSPLSRPDSVASAQSDSTGSVHVSRSYDMIPQEDPWEKLVEEGLINTKSLSCNSLGQQTVQSSVIAESLLSMPWSQQSVARSSRSISNCSRSLNPDSSFCSLPDGQYTASIRTIDSGYYEEGSTLSKIGHFVRTRFDISLLLSVTFLGLSLSGILSMLGIFVPYLFLQVKATEVDRAQDGPFLVSIIGIANIFGRITFGWAGDRPWADPLHLSNTAMVVAGVATMLCPFSTSFVGLAIYAAVFGFTIAGFVSLQSVILVDLLGLEKLTNSFGLLILFQGIASICGTPLAAFICEQYNDVSMTFYSAGAMILLAGLVGYPLRRIRKWELRRNKLVGEETPPLHHEGINK